MADAVQTFRAISWLIFKWLLIVLLGLVVLTALGIGAYLGWDWYSYDRHVEKIDPHVRIDPELCKQADYPLFAAFFNRSSRQIDSVTFTIQAKVPGRSSNIADYHSYSSDTIIKPGDGLGHCYRLPKFKEFAIDHKTLEWSLIYVRYTFGK